MYLFALRVYISVQVQETWRKQWKTPNTRITVYSLHMAQIAWQKFPHELGYIDDKNIWMSKRDVTCVTPAWSTHPSWLCSPLVWFT